MTVFKEGPVTAPITTNREISALLGDNLAMTHVDDFMCKHFYLKDQLSVVIRVFSFSSSDIGYVRGQYQRIIPLLT